VVENVSKANPEDFIHLFLNNSERLVEFLEHLVKSDTRSSYSNEKVRYLYPDINSLHFLQMEHTCL
jgi:hypothetical protein